jgi:ABC-2 type transport system permease protein
VTRPVFLIAEREFRAYVATLSFWVALVIGPLVVGGGLLFAQGYHRGPALLTVSIESPDPALAQSVKTAIAEAGRLEGRHYRFGKIGVPLSIARIAPGRVALDFGPHFPLSASGRVLVARTLERDAARRHSSNAALEVHATMPATPMRRLDAGTIARFALLMMLWLTLTGSLGMLLQTVVRERATRALESLLAAATPWQIMAGKLLGVGTVSLLVLAAWLGSSALLAIFSQGTGSVAHIIAELAAPEALLRAALIYLLAYGFYGSLTIAFGARARDSASAQNLSRPMFILLVVAFFIPLASITAGAAPGPSWLIFVPPFTPFLMLLYPPGAIPVSIEFVLLALLLISSVIAARIAVRGFTLSDRKPLFFGWRLFSRDAS